MNKLQELTVETNNHRNYTKENTFNGNFLFIIQNIYFQVVV